MFAPDGGYVGIIDARRKEAIALFRVTDMNVGRSVHMSFWTADGSAIIVANLNGKTLERIEITRNPSGKIMQAAFNRSDLLQATPDGRHIAVAFRGPAPVTVNHSAQGSCPHTVDDAATTSPGGVNYAGLERSDVHGASVIAK